MTGAASDLGAGRLHHELARARQDGRHARRVELGARGVGAREPGAQVLAGAGRRQADEDQGGQEGGDAAGSQR